MKEVPLAELKDDLSRPRQRNAAARIRRGDKLVCYMTKLSRWVGILEVVDGPYEDVSPIFYPESDPFVVRFRVSPAIWLPVDKSIPIHDDRIWNALSFTRGQSKASSTWIGKIQGSLVQLDDEDGRLLEAALRAQVNGGKVYEVDPDEYSRYTTHRVRRADKDVTVTVPVEAPVGSTDAAELVSDVRESLRVQALLAQIGSSMGMQIWLPRGDRAAVLGEWQVDHPPVLERFSRSKRRKPMFECHLASGSRRTLNSCVFLAAANFRPRKRACLGPLIRGG
ncbi:MAG: hypothetical protein ACT4NU_14290 [Chromatiales bacterium]